MFDIKEFLESNKIFMDLFMTEGGKAKAVVTPLSTSIYVFGISANRHDVKKRTLYACIGKGGNLITIGDFNGHAEPIDEYEKQCAREVHILYNK